ncbi:uncharacterized protein LOC119370186 [Jatropha curcas]|uniref:uncharacterized protein LOC119370186 n=1 Tax=Jatropha curcas TaxID=180498 RepID=UPI0018941372|nr:uncharacterized protein LOC119370186 [Jatropha curcas]
MAFVAVKNTFLHGEVDHEIYMEQPLGFRSLENPNYVYSSLFMKDQEGRLAIVLVYVDDLIVTGDNIEEIQLIQTHPEEFGYSFHDETRKASGHYLGLEIEEAKEGLYSRQQKVCKRFCLKRVEMMEWQADVLLNWMLIVKLCC